MRQYIATYAVSESLVNSVTGGQPFWRAATPRLSDRKTVRKVSYRFDAENDCDAMELARQEKRRMQDCMTQVSVIKVVEDR